MLRFARTSRPWFVMAGRGEEASLRADVPAIHVLGAASKCVDTRHKAGHDGVEKRCVTYGVWRPHPPRGWNAGQQTSSWPGEATSFASRRRSGHPRALVPRARTWMPDTRPGMTVLR